MGIPQVANSGDGMLSGVSLSLYLISVSAFGGLDGRTVIVCDFFRCLLFGT